MESSEQVFHNLKTFDKMRAILNKDPNLEKDKYRANKDYKEHISSAFARYTNRLTHETLTLRYERERKS